MIYLSKTNSLSIDKLINIPIKVGVWGSKKEQFIIYCLTFINKLFSQNLHITPNRSFQILHL